MKTAPIPSNEKERLESLYGLNILDTAPEERFDRITRLALRLFNVPISTITLIDSKREWFKSCQGLSQRQGERAISFCGHAMLATKLLIIPDARKDKRFADNPMVVGKPFIRFYAAMPLKTPDGFPVGVFCVKDTKPRVITRKEMKLLKDLAKWAELELNMHELKSTLQDRKKRENELVSIASHELRTPMTAIKGFVDLILHGAYGSVNGRLSMPLSEISKSTERLIRLVNDILNVSRIEGGKIRLNVSEFAVQEAIKEVMLSLQPIAKNNGIYLKTKKLSSCVVRSDVNKVKEVLVNIVGNALKFTHKGGVVVSMEEEKNSIRIFIKDTGMGIAKENQNKLFEKFEQVISPGQSRPEGSGLGLYISKELAKKMGGDVLLDKSQAGKGSTFVFSLPRRGKALQKRKK